MSTKTLFMLRNDLVILLYQHDEFLLMYSQSAALFYESPFFLFLAKALWKHSVVIVWFRSCCPYWPHRLFQEPFVSPQAVFSQTLSWGYLHPLQIHLEQILFVVLRCETCETTFKPLQCGQICEFNMHLAPTANANYIRNNKESIDLLSYYISMCYCNASIQQHRENTIEVHFRCKGTTVQL